jgi:hypothetical protein
MYRPTMCLNVLKSTISGISVAVGHNQLVSVRFAINKITFGSEPKI